MSYWLLVCIGVWRKGALQKRVFKLLHNFVCETLSAGGLIETRRAASLTIELLKN